MAASGAAVGLAACLAWIAALSPSAIQLDNRQQQQLDDRSAAVPDKEPLFSLDEVAKHRTADTGIWVTYGTGVYDVTEFISQHPGGDKILMAAGGPIEPFWAVYTIHDSAAVRAILSQMRIGRLDEASVAQRIQQQEQCKQVAVDDPFSGDPGRSPLLSVLSRCPFNAETPMALLGDQFITPTPLFYTRNHLPVPVVDDVEASGDGGGYRLAVQRPTGDFVEFSVSQLRQGVYGGVHTITAALQCAGNRRKQLEAVAPVQGLGWTGGAIGNAEWTGVWLRDLLTAAGWSLAELQSGSTVRHVLFDALDGYGASIPVHKAVSPDGDVMLAFDMNGQPLTRDHGYPVRAIVPGHAGARSVKWLNKVTLSAAESDSHWQQRDYKGFSPSTDWDKTDWASASAIQEMPVQSAILEPSPGWHLPADSQEVTVRGYAWSGGGRGIERVDVSADGGQTWHVATIDRRAQDQPPHKQWAWCLWTADVPLTPGTTGSVELVCKAVDSSYNVQPDTSQGIFNKRGVLSTAWDRVRLVINN